MSGKQAAGRGTESNTGKLWLVLHVWVLPVLLFMAFFAAYLLTPTKYYTYDSVAYASQIRSYDETGRAGWLFHPHHLIFNVLGFLTWRLIVMAGVKADYLLALQYMNAFFAALGLALIYTVLRNGGLGLRSNRSVAANSAVPFAATAAFGCAYGYWVCATDGRVNVLALWGVILTVGFAWGMIASPSVRQCIAAAGATVLAIAFHQSNGLLMLAGCAAMLLSGVPWHSRIRYAALYVGLVIAGIAVLYLSIGVGVKDLRSLNDLQRWALAYGHDGRWWSFNIKANILQDAKAFVHVFVTADASRAGFGRLLRLVPVSLALLVIVQALRIPFRLQKSRSLSDADNLLWRKLVILLAVAVPYSAFFTVWNPGYFVFWLPVGFVVVAWAAVAASAQRLSVRIAMMAICFAIAASGLYVNLPSTIIPKLSPYKNPNLIFCNRLNTVADKGDLIIATDSNAKTSVMPIYADVYLPYFSRLSVRSLSTDYKASGGEASAAARYIRGIIKARMRSGHRVIMLVNYDKGGQLRTQKHSVKVCELIDRIQTGCRLEPIFSNNKFLGYRVLSLHD